MPFDSVHSPDADARSRRGLSNYLSGLSAETIVAEHYQAAGHRVLEQRWRGKAGEIDLIVEGPDGLVFVEVKKGRDHAAAASHLTAPQIGRVALAAEEYAGRTHGMACLRIDAALVDQTGTVDIIRNISL